MNIKRSYMILLAGFFLFILIPCQSHAEEIDLNIQSEAAVLVDGKTGQILYGKNAEKRMYPASITKIATAIYALENADMDEMVTVSENAVNVDGTRVYLEAGEKVTMRQLLIGMILNSGNDAAQSIAEHIDKNQETFEENINRFLKEETGVQDTHFENPHGLFAENHYTTAADMAVITKYALGNEEFRKIFQMKEYKWDSASWDTTLITHHRLLKGEFPYEGITGGKNGFVNESGQTLVTTASKDGLELIAVTLKTHYKNVPYTDTIQLLDYGFTNFIHQFIPKDTKFKHEKSEFLVSEDLYYTAKKGSNYFDKINDNGILQIINAETEQPIKEFQLTEVNRNRIMAEETSANPKKADVSGAQLGGVSVIVLFFIGIGYFLLSRKKIRKWL